MPVSVLIIDDDLNMCETLKDIIEDDQYCVDWVNNCDVAIDMMAERSFQVVLLEFNPNNERQCVAYQTISLLYPHIRVILITSVSPFQWEEFPGFNNNAEVTCLSKPFNLDDILYHIKKSRVPE